jgi:sugar lactone lactonase YvrE
MPSLNPGLYSIIFMNSFFGQYTPSNVEYSDTGRTYAEFVLAVNDYSPKYVLSNPGTTTLNTITTQAGLSLTLTNPLNLTPIWSYPTIPGVSWATTPTSITLTAAQGTSYATNTITVQASFLTFDYPQSFSLTIDNVTPVLNGVVTTFLTGLFYPQALVHDNTNTIYLSDTSNNLVKKVNATTAAFTTLYSGLTSGVAYDGSTYIYVTNYNTHNIYRINATTGAFITFAGTGSGGSANGTGTAASFSFPQGITYDSAGFLYVADTNNSTIRKITVPGAVVTTLAGLAGTTGSADGTGTAARFQFPYDVEYDGFGNVYVADSSNNTIRKIVVSTGVVTTFAGLAGTSGSADGIGTAARFNFPNGVTCDGNNKLVYVTDRNNQIIRQILVNNASVTTLAGLAGTSGDVNGTGSAARFYRPQGATVDKTTGTLFVLDTYNQKMKKIT